MDISSENQSFKIGRSPNGWIGFMIQSIETYYPSIEVNITIDDQWIQVDHQSVWIERTVFQNFVDQLSDYARGVASYVNLVGMSPDELSLQIQGTRWMHVAYQLQKNKATVDGVHTHQVRGSFNCSVEYRNQLVIETQQILAFLESFWH